MKIARASKIPTLLTLFMILLSAWPCSAQQDEHHNEIIPQIKMDNVPLPDVVKNLARQAGINFILDPRVLSDSSAPPVTITFENLSAQEALDRVLKIRRLVRIESSATSVSRIAPANLSIKPVNPELLKNDTNAAIPLIMMEDVPLRDALVNLARQIHLNIDFDEKLNSRQSILSAPVSLRWTHLTGKQALVALLDNYDLIMQEDSSVGAARIVEKKAPPKSP